MKKYMGVGFLILLLLQQQWQLSAGKGQGFIKTRGVQFVLDETPYYANGFNAYWLMYVASDPTQRYKVSSAFEQAQNHGLAISRTWAFSDGGYSPLQYSPGSYNDQMFQGLDYVISEARKYGIKVILSLVNNYENLGGKKQYVDWARGEGESITSDDDFFTNDVVKRFYKSHIKSVVTRMNTVTGVAYKDDPTIMAWELMNEPRCTSDPSGTTIQGWITEMASYLKSIDNNHLLEAGLEGFYGESAPQKQQFNPNFQVGTDFIANNQIASIDFATLHSYPDQWLSNGDDESEVTFLDKWVSSHIEDAENIVKKPILLTEFGKSDKDVGFSTGQRDDMFNTVYSAIYSSAKGGGAAAGGMFWQLLTEELMDPYRDGYEIVFAENPSTATLIAHHSYKLINITKMYQRLEAH